MSSKSVLWTRSDVPGLEWCRLASEPGGETLAGSLAGSVVLAWEGVPWRIDYAIELDTAGQTRLLTIGADGQSGGAASHVNVRLEADGDGRWRHDGELVIDDREALDCDLGFSPSTNTLPIRRLGLEVGQRREIAVAWILFPSFEIVLGQQSYERLAEQTWRYRSAGFEADLTVDEDGLVEAYYVWQAVARA
ncbi:MAG TPA: putative glycolipid-binding domain-containing protein [Candidatus Limnocylindrales bacterium]|nr:putative glycolipid-binding domain-containing protein [Candidatus Limnocylindrales bacterium]